MKKLVASVAAAALTLSAASALAVTVKPIREIDLDDLTDCELQISAEAEDVTSDSIYAKVYETLVYDGAEIRGLRTGDKIEGRETVEIEKIKKKDEDEILINGGFTKDGITLWENEDGTYTPIEDDDADGAVMIGEAQLTLADQVEVSVWQYDDNGGISDEMLTQTVDAEDVYDALFGNDNVSSLSRYNTTVTLENGVVTEIIVQYTP